MPRPDPPPRLRASHLRHFRRVVKLLALFSLVIAMIAVLLVASGDEGTHIHMMIATALGVGFMVFLGTALMSLVFLSSSSGHDEEVARFEEEKPE
ncbi:MAG TPA: hypothetical protein VNH53_10075 [Sphingomicrobium sp.]|jgi:hypothetical protein|nr:hypothetical protein [Sphingomicrobium sp.]